MVAGLSDDVRIRHSNLRARPHGVAMSLVRWQGVDVHPDRLGRVRRRVGVMADRDQVLVFRRRA